MIFVPAMKRMDVKKKGSERTNQLAASECKYKCNYGTENWFDSLERGHCPSALQPFPDKEFTEHVMFF